MGYKFNQLTAPGTSEVTNARSMKSHVCQFVVASIDTNVVIRFEGSLDGTNYFNINPNGDTTITANGTYAISKSNMPLLNVRVVFVSEAGGTAATVDALYEGYE